MREGGRTLLAMLPRRRRRSQHEPDRSMPRRSSALKRGVVSWAWMLEKQVSWARMLEKQDRGYRQPASSSCTGQRRRGRVEVTGNRQAAHEEEEQCRWSRHSS